MKCTVLHAIQQCYNVENTECLPVTLVTECGSGTVLNFMNFFELYYCLELFRTFWNFKLISLNFITMALGRLGCRRTSTALPWSSRECSRAYGTRLSADLAECSVCISCRSRRALEHRKNMDEDRLAELEQMLKDANDTVIETEKRFAEVCSFICVNRS